MGSKLIVTGFVFGSLFALIGIAGLIFSDKLIHYMITSSMRLTPDSDIYKQWMNPPVEVHMNFYLFNLKNGPDFERNGSKPIFEEIGPFVYKEVITKEAIVDNYNYTITYQELRRYFFLPELSPYEDTYPITTLNMAPIAVIFGIRYTPGLVHSAVNLALKITGDTLLITKPAKEILFGYEDPFLKLLSTLDKKLVPTPMVGLFYGKNDTIDGTYTMYTGADSYTNMGIIQRFNYQDEMSYWSNQYANMINGTDGTVAPPFLDESSVIWIFESDLCRSLNAIYNKTETIIDNIKVLGYSPSEYFFANHSVNPDNEGFCIPAGNCLPAGVLNLTTCVGGIPIIMSCPHFLFGAPQFTQDVVGVKPDLSQHQTMIFIEPLTGVIMKANKRIQFNTQLFRDSRIDITKKLPEILYPLFWVDENFNLDQKNADLFKNQVVTPLAVINYGKYAVGATGLLIIFISLAFYVRNRRRRSGLTTNDENIVDESSPLIINNS